MPPGKEQPRAGEAPPPRDDQAFKTCTFCRHVWPSREAFLTDPQISLVGYQAFSPDLVLGLFLFNHLVCKTTLAIHAREFVDLYDGPIYGERLDETEACQGHCKDTHDLEPCAQRCECAYVREVVQLVRQWPKEGTAA
jgi:hypothetical protein